MLTLHIENIKQEFTFSWELLTGSIKCVLPFFSVKYTRKRKLLYNACHLSVTLPKSFLHYCLHTERAVKDDQVIRASELSSNTSNGRSKEHYAFRSVRNCFLPTDHVLPD